jgi:hypothetical protein
MGKVKGDVNLVSYSEGEDIKEDPELLQTVMEVIDFGEMPPEENNPIPKHERQIIVKTFEGNVGGGGKIKGRGGGCSNTPNDPISICKCSKRFIRPESRSLSFARENDARPIRLLQTTYRENAGEDDGEQSTTGEIRSDRAEDGWSGSFSPGPAGRAWLRYSGRSFIAFAPFDGGFFPIEPEYCEKPFL